MNLKRIYIAAKGYEYEAIYNKTECSIDQDRKDSLYESFHTYGLKIPYQKKLMTSHLEITTL